MTSQKPSAVLDAGDYYETSNAAVHRGAHQLAEEATDAYESARAAIAGFVGARGRHRLHQERAESLNLAAYAFSNATAKAAGGVVDPRWVLTPRAGGGDRDGAPRESHSGRSLREDRGATALDRSDRGRSLRHGPDAVMTRRRRSPQSCINRTSWNDQSCPFDYGPGATWEPLESSTLVSHSPYARERG